ncbi:MAG: phosphatidate cytidylyltransferase [Oscillospiraceae bacterium]|nr:phosphatidate cytidylyltransferase [Oscillospiraceae bacterium]
MVLILIEGRFLLTLGVIAISVISMWEFYRAVGLVKISKLLCILGIWGSCAIAILAAYQIGGTPLIPSKFLMLTGFVYVISLLIIMLLKHKSIKLTDIAMIIVGNVYVAYLLVHIILVRHLEFGHLLVWLIFLGAFMTDTFAYFVGVLFGKHKLCPNISPKKTIEGAIGGIVGCGLSFLLFGMIVNRFFADVLLRYEYMPVQYLSSAYYVIVPQGSSFSLPLMFALGLICSIAAQVGDLVASTIKRQYDIKDFGRILPGHGGVLDRFDSILFVAPVVYLFLTHIEVIV